MEILQNLWNVLVTEDENLTKYVCLCLTFVEIFVTMKLFTTIFNINYTKKQRNIYVIIMSILIILSSLFIPTEYSIFIHLILTPFIIKTIFKTNILKSILAEIIPMFISVLLETLYLKICYKMFSLTLQMCKSIIIYRIPIMLFIYLTIYLISKLFNTIQINYTEFEKLDKTHKHLIILNLILVIVCIGFQFYLMIFYNLTLPIYITILTFLFLITYSVVSIYSIIKTLNFESAKSDLEQTQLHNKTLEILYSNTRAFKHDFSNILTAFGGFIYAKNLDGLEKYYNKVLEECHIDNNLSALNPTVINNPAIYNILATKYYKADELGINIDLQIFINLNNLKMDVYDFTRILGILLDNAIEASAKCNEKIIKIEIRDLSHQHCQILNIENTYLDNNLDMSRLSEKGYTSKTDDTENHGIGLWQVSKMIKKYNNVILDTSKNDEFFKQELVIYY